MESTEVIGWRAANKVAKALNERDEVMAKVELNTFWSDHVCSLTPFLESQKNLPFKVRVTSVVFGLLMPLLPIYAVPTTTTAC